MHMSLSLSLAELFLGQRLPPRLCSPKMLQQRAMHLVLALALASSCGGRADEQEKPAASEPEPPPFVGRLAEPSAASLRPSCSPSQELFCEALGSSAAERCVCRDVMPNGATGCAVAEQLVCSDAGTSCICDG